MRFLLDTHAFLWWATDAKRLPSPARNAINDPQNEAYLSAVVGWEVQIKRGLGRIVFSTPWSEIVDHEVTRNGFLHLPITIAHTEPVGELPAIHRDPFDRLLIAQSFVEKMTLVTGDEKIAQYPGVSVLWE